MSNKKKVYVETTMIGDLTSAEGPVKRFRETISSILEATREQEPGPRRARAD